jgi:hypothetical protein
VGTQSDIRDQRYRAEPDIGTSDIGLKSAESNIISDIGINFCLYPISDTNLCKSLLRSVKLPDTCHEGCEFENRKMMCQINLLGSLGNDWSILDIGISNIDLVPYRNGS